MPFQYLHPQGYAAITNQSNFRTLLLSKIERSYPLQLLSIFSHHHSHCEATITLISVFLALSIPCKRNHTRGPFCRASLTENAVCDVPPHCGLHHHSIPFHYQVIDHWVNISHFYLVTKKSHQLCFFPARPHPPPPHYLEGFCAHSGIRFCMKGFHFFLALYLRLELQDTMVTFC